MVRVQACLCPPPLAPTHPSTHIPHPRHNRNHHRQHRFLNLLPPTHPPTSLTHTTIATTIANSTPTITIDIVESAWGHYHRHYISPLPIHASPCWASLQSTIWSLPIQHVFEVIPMVGLWVSCGLCLSKLANPASLSFFLSHYTRKCSTNCLKMACCQMLNARMANLVV